MERALHLPKDLVVLPTSRFVLPELQNEFGAIPPALIPFDGTPAFRQITSNAMTNGGQVVLASHQGIEQLVTYAQRHPSLPIEIVDVGDTKSIGDTVLTALAKVETDNCDRLVINFADTLVSDVPYASDIVCFARLQNTHRWTTFSIDDGRISATIEKNIDKTFGEHPVFTGVFAIGDVNRFVGILTVALASNENDIDPFYVAITQYFNETPNALLHETHAWYDFGHVDTYYAARQQFFLNKREFNAVTVDSRRGVIRKTSTNADKLANEIRWYLDLPKSAAHLAPRVFDYSLDDNNVFVDMEFYGYVPLGESYLHGAWDAGVWIQVFESASEVLKLLSDHHAPSQDATATNSTLRAMYETKTRQRCAQITDENLFGPLLGNEVVINGQRSLGLQGALAHLDAAINVSKLCDRSDNSMTLMHGDFCLSNMLFDRRTGIIRLIDPRGSFANVGIWGDPLYDIAKLTHSIAGNYDHLLQGLFDLSVFTDGVYLDVHLTPIHHAVKTQYEFWLQGYTGADFTRVKFIESLLFLSMVPLHSDRRKAQMAFLTNGLQLFSDAARRLGVWNPHAASAETNFESKVQ